MSAPRPTAPRGLATGMVLVVVGLLAWILFVVQSGGEVRSYAHGGQPPQFVQVDAGHSYGIAIPGGVDAEVNQGLDPSALKCSAAASGYATAPLTLTVEASDSKATNQIASFVAPLSEYLHIDCTGIGNVYVDDAADAGTDWSGLWLLIACLALAVGLPLTLSALRSGPRPARPEPRYLEDEPVG